MSLDFRRECDELEERRLKILKVKEETWRQKSRAIWLAKGDLNTHFFHCFANQRRINNVIWEVRDGNGNTICGQNDLQEDVARHFKNIFTQRRGISITNQLNVIQLFPSFFSEEEALWVSNPIT